ncbi:MAG TPA: hypothetical protein VJS68_03400 [Thermoplasmata archaeon]|nr:hypothetical protein [Thermoplasmata archaeon]
MPRAEDFDYRLDGSWDAARMGEQEQQDLQAGRSGIRVGWAGVPWLSLGVAQRGVEALRQRAHSGGVEVHPRSTGGTAVLISPGDLLFSLVLRRTHPLAASPVTKGYGRLGAGACRFLERFRIRGEWSAPAGLSDLFCPLGALGSPLRADGRVLGGAAQHLTGTHVLHHGFLFRSLDRLLLGRLFGLSASVLSNELTSLSELGIPAEPPQQAAQLLDAWSSIIDSS